MEQRNVSDGLNATLDPRLSITLCPLRKQPLELRGVGIAELTVSTALFIVNVFFLCLLYRRRRLVHWRTHVYTLNLAISDLFASMALLAMSISVMVMSSGDKRWCLGARSPMPEWVEIGVQAVVTTSVCLTVLNYNVLVTAQYFAIRLPILHRTYCGTRRFRWMIIASQWVLVLAYVDIKSAVIYSDPQRRSAIFSIFELTFMGLSIAWSVGAYSYVLHVARTWQKRRLDRQRAMIDRLTTSSSTPARESEDSLRKLSRVEKRRRLISTASLSDMWVSLWSRYQTITNAGIHLAIYVVACVPMWLVRVLTVLDVGIHNSGSMYDVYSCSSVWCSVTVCLWFFRGVMDPLVHVWRHPELIRGTPASTPAGSPPAQLVQTVTQGRQGKVSYAIP